MRPGPLETQLVKFFYLFGLIHLSKWAWRGLPFLGCEIGELEELTKGCLVLKMVRINGFASLMTEENKWLIPCVK